MVVVEHDKPTIQAADWIIDIGPGAGDHGGEIMAEEIIKDGVEITDAGRIARL